ncbi:MAG: hypothetical protein ISR90_04530 [Candidatus Marinimicrobia bacterium]|nr:hypothetical protein [Candidatus Neomarinimicrobiota bacterium]MBL7023304.1 hypothetical protein [Candidatus Neomarinimicrobiota bacterium]
MIFIEDDKPSFTVSASTIYPYQLNYLQLTELDCKINYKDIVYHLKTQTTGDEIYKEIIVQFSTEKKINNKLRLGLILSNYHIHINNYGNSNCSTIGLTIKTKIAENLKTRILIPNLTALITAKLFEEIPKTLTVSLIKELPKNQRINYIIEKDVLFDLDHQIFWTIDLLSFIGVRVGYKSLTNETVWNLNLKYNKYHIKFGIILHSVLGTSTGFGISYE